MRLVENTGRKKSPKIRHLRTIAQLCRALSLQLTHVSTIRMFSQYGGLRATSS